MPAGTPVLPTMVIGPGLLAGLDPKDAAAVTAYAGGTSEGLVAWLRHCAVAVQVGAAEGVAIGDAVVAGRLSP